MLKRLKAAKIPVASSHLCTWHLESVEGRKNLLMKFFHFFGLHFSTAFNIGGSVPSAGQQARGPRLGEGQANTLSSGRPWQQHLYNQMWSSCTLWKSNSASLKKSYRPFNIFWRLRRRKRSGVWFSNCIMRWATGTYAAAFPTFLLSVVDGLTGLGTLEPSWWRKMSIFKIGTLCIQTYCIFSGGGEMSEPDTRRAAP